MFGLSGQQQEKQLNPRERMAQILSGQEPTQPAQPDGFGSQDWQQAAMLRNRGASPASIGGLAPSALGYAMPQKPGASPAQLAAFQAQQQAAQKAGGYAAPESGAAPTSSAGGIGTSAPGAPAQPTSQQLYAIQQWLRSPQGQQWSQTPYGQSEIARRSWQSLL